MFTLDTNTIVLTSDRLTLDVCALLLLGLVLVSGVLIIFKLLTYTIHIEQNRQFLLDEALKSVIIASIMFDESGHVLVGKVVLFVLDGKINNLLSRCRSNRSITL